MRRERHRGNCGRRSVQKSLQGRQKGKNKKKKKK